MPRRRAGRRSPQHWSSGRAARSNRKSAWCSSTPAPGGCTAAKPLIFRRFDRMRIAILDPAAGISGDMTLGALLSAGAPAAWLEALPRRLDLPDVRVTVREVKRSGVACMQVEFAIPEQPHGRHVGELVRLVERAPLSDWVKERAVRAFRLIGEAEGRVHGVAPDKVHLHEVGAVDAVLDIVGGIEGFAQLGVEAVYNFPVAVGSGWVEAADAGRVVLLATDVDDMSPEYVEPLRQALVSAGALDVQTWPVQMKKGRSGFRVEVMAPEELAEGVTAALFRHSTTAGIRRWVAERATLPRRQVTVQLSPEVAVRVKVLEQTDAGGGGVRLKPEYDEVLAAARALGRPPLEIARAAERDAEALVAKSKA